MAEDPNAPPPVEVTTDNEPGSAAVWRKRIEKAKRVRKDLVSDWSTNIDYRRGKPFASESDEHRVAVNPDWALTKAKQAALFSQVPAVTVTSDFGTLKGAAPIFMKALNKRLTKAKVDVAMDEVMPDVINAAGIGAVYVGYQALTVEKMVPSVDTSQMPPEQVQQMQAMGQIEMVPVPQVVSKRFYARRISPSDLLIPSEFMGSNFDDAPWIGQTGRMTWAEAVNEFGLTEEDKEKATSGDSRTAMEKYGTDNDPDKDNSEEDTVVYDELFYWKHRYDANEKYFECIGRMVFVEGLDEPVKNEAWNGQKLVGDKYLGAHTFPIRVCTLTYLTDESTPPSDSAIGRPQVNELIKSRTQMVLQRERSQPVRYFDVNRIDPQIQDTLQRGTWQGMIPINGRGEDAMGELARSTMPREDFEFDRVAKADLQDTWRLGPNQLGQFASGERSAEEAQNVQQGFQTGNSYERARVGKFFVGIAEVMAGLMSLYDDFKEILDEQEVAALDGMWNRQERGNDFLYTIRPDSTVLLDSEQRIQQLTRTLNITGKSGYINPQPLIAEIMTLSGTDLAGVMVDPTPPEPTPAAVSVRINGAVELLNPLMLAFLVKSGQAPSPQDLAAAVKMLQAAQKASEAPDMPVPSPPPPMDGGRSTEGQAPPESQLADWESMPRVSKRPSEPGG